MHVSSRPHDPERARDMLERAADAYRALAAFRGIGPDGGGCSQFASHSGAKCEHPGRGGGLCS